MPEVELIMPKMGESIMEATILSWLKKEGDSVEEEESILEIATDKVDSEVPSPVSGVITKLLYKENDVIEVGKAIAIISTEASGAAPVTKTPVVEVSAPKPIEVAQPVQQAQPAAAQPAVAATTETVSSNRFYSPLVLNISRQEGIAMSELENLPGTGKDGRVTKKDILAYVKNRGAQPSVAVASNGAVAQTPIAKPAVSATPSTPVSHGADVEIVEMDRMRKLIADHMVMSVQTSPHVTSFVEADVTNLVTWRNNIKAQFLAQEGEKITFTPLIMEAVVKALKDFPGVNASVDGNNVLLKKNINVGMAAALPNGNLIVPVIKNADQMNLIGLTKQVNDLASRARAGKLKPQDIEGGTFTLTNVGTFGNVMGTPIINQPQVAIMAAGAIRKKPVVLETEMGDVIAIRHMMYLSHSYDHRVVDGMMGGSFVRKVADYLEAFDVNRDI